MFTKKRLIIVVVSLAVGIILAVTYYYNAVETKPFHGSKHPPKSARLSQSDLADEILDLESKVDDLGSKNNDLESKIDDVENDNGILRSRIADLESKIEELRSEFDELETCVDKFMGRHGYLPEKEILEKRIDYLETQISNLNFRLSYR